MVPRRAGVAPSECCSKLAENRGRAPESAYSAWSTVNCPVRGLLPRPLPDTSSPGWLLVLSGKRVGPVYVVPGTNRALFGAQKLKYHQSVWVETLSEMALL